MHMVNMGLNTKRGKKSALPRQLVLVENMSMNTSIPTHELLRDLMESEGGQVSVNEIRDIIKKTFEVQMKSIPFNQAITGGSPESHEAVIHEIAALVADKCTPFVLGNVQVDGRAMVQLIQELVTQIKSGGKQFNMVTATEAMVGNMATEAAQVAWGE